MKKASIISLYNKNADAHRKSQEARASVARSYRVGDATVRLGLEGNDLCMAITHGALCTTEDLLRVAEISALKDAWNAGRIDASKLPPSDPHAVRNY